MCTRTPQKDELLLLLIPDTVYLMKSISFTSFLSYKDNFRYYIRYTKNSIS